MPPAQALTLANLTGPGRLCPASPRHIIMPIPIEKGPKGVTTETDKTLVLASILCNYPP